MERKKPINIVAWIGLTSVLAFTLVPLMFKKVKTDEEKRSARRILYILLGIVIAVIIFRMSLITAFIIGFMAIVFVQRKNYTKKQLVIYTTVVLLLLATTYFILGTNSAFVQSH
ncbi:hypothetical protein ACFOLA_08900 [Salinicoccus hispanicus]|uniref:Uncharacterized protein n=1 Tax=Salinicoccus hispanicus TaxID=157225 RepID=A0A6N8TZ58_9STAP|nr:hypothetical protein [Salinicoccus hispanicus]MXQ49986.1 hypothetical protein [Salinicoccus hispanicus]